MKILKNVLLYDLLTYGSNEYNNLLLNMLKDEFYIMQDRTYDLFIEIYNDDNLVGFMVGNFYNKVLIVELGYLLPEVRDDGLFCDCLLGLKQNYGVIWLDMPNGFLIRSLLNNGLAVKINDYLVKTDLPLSFKKDDGFRVNSVFYDLRISGVVELFEGVVSPMMSVDAECFSAENGREKYLDGNYFNEIVKVVYNGIGFR